MLITVDFLSIGNFPSSINLSWAKYRNNQYYYLTLSYNKEMLELRFCNVLANKYIN